MDPMSGEELRQCQYWAVDKMIEFGLTRLGWTFHWDNAVVRFGVCKFRVKRIGISQKIARRNTRSHFEDTVLHEIAHALAGPGHGHGRQWKAVARAIGCTAQRCYGAEVVQPMRAYTAICPNVDCLETFQRHRMARTACAKCCRKHNGGKFDIRFLLTWRKKLK